MKTCTLLIVITCISSCHGCHNTQFCRKKRATTNSSSNFGYLHGGCRRSSPIKLKASDEEKNLRWLLTRFDLTDVKMNNELVECVTSKESKGETYSLLEKLVRATRLRKYKSVYAQNQKYYCVDAKHKTSCQKIKDCLDLLQGKSPSPSTTTVPSVAITRPNTNEFDTKMASRNNKKLQGWIDWMTSKQYFKKLFELLSDIRYAIITYEDDGSYGGYEDGGTEEYFPGHDYHAQNYRENHQYDPRSGIPSKGSYYAIEYLWKNLEDFIEQILLEQM